MTKYRDLKDKLGIGCNKNITPKEGSNYENKYSTSYMMCQKCKELSDYIDDYIYEVIEFNK